MAQPSKVGNKQRPRELWTTGVAGSAFKLSPQPDGNWTESVIHSFGGSGDGLNPYGGLVLVVPAIFGVEPHMEGPGREPSLS